VAAILPAMLQRRAGRHSAGCQYKGGTERERERETETETENPVTTGRKQCGDGGLYTRAAREREASAHACNSAGQ